MVQKNVINPREQKIERLKSFEIPSKRNGNYIFYKRYLKDLQKTFNTYIKANEKVLDIGCGNKPFEKFIRELIKKNDKEYYVGCDVAQSSENRVDILCEATDIPELTETYDVIICTQVIEHVVDHSKVFEEAYRLLKNGGRFIVSSCFVWEKHEVPYDYYRFTDYCFEILLTRSGFIIKEGISNGGKWAVLGQLIIQCLVKKDHSNSFFYRVFKYVWNGGITLLCNILFNYMDNRYNNTDSFSLNYIFVGEKKL